MKLTIETECPHCNISAPATSTIHFLGKDNFLGKDIELKLQLKEVAMLNFYCPNCGNYIANEIEIYVEEE